MKENKKVKTVSRFFRNRNAIVAALNKTVEIFTSHNEEAFEDLMANGLKPVADAAGLDRIAVYRLSPETGCLGQIYVWAYGKTTALDEKMAEIPKNVPPIAGWLEILSKGECVNGNVNEMPEDQADFCTLMGVKFIFLIPVFTRGEFWGVVAIEDHTNYRYFEKGCLDLLRSAALLCANAVIRNEITREAAAARELTCAITEASPVPYVLFNGNMQAIDCNDAALLVFACPDKQYFLEHYWDRFLPKTQPDGYVSFEEALKLRDKTDKGGQTKFEWMHLSFNGEQIPLENTLTQVIYRGKKLYISFKYDLRNNRKMMENIREQSEQLKTRLEQEKLICDITRGFISSGDSKDHINDVMAKLGQYHNVSEVSIFKIDNEHDEAYPMYHWTAAGLSLCEVKFDMFSLVKSKFPRRLPDCGMLPIVACADIASSQCEDFKVLLSFNINAFISVPLYVDGLLWGVLYVEQCFAPRQWTENEKNFVAMTARAIAGVIMRNIYTEKLKEALEEATLASKAKGEFLSNISHEIRTPLNAIIGLTTICKNTSDPEYKKHTLGRIEDASTHLLGVINDVLDISKIEAKKFELSPSEFDFEKMLQRVVSVVNFRVEEKQQKFVVRIDREIPHLLIGDEQRLAQVITNIVGNAVKFTPSGGEIRIDTKSLGEEKGMYTIQISVTDSGIGLSPEQQERLFRPFQQAENATSRKFGGTGLGLSISKNIVEMMDGKIWIESELGKGATFTFTIKVKRSEKKAQRSPGHSVNWKNVRILAVDDDTDTLTFFKVILEELGASCDTARSAEEALSLVDQNRIYDVVFVDWKLPGIDGVQMTSILKGEKNNGDNLSVVLFSAAAWTTVEKEARKAGVDKFLSKPLFPSVIIETVNECLGTDSGSADVETEASVPVFPGRRILLAEDIEINREIVLALLEPTQLEIDSAENGAVAVEMFREAPQKYDMIFMDMQMPEMDGVTAVKNIRALDIPKAKTIPIIAMTANVFQEDVKKCIDAGMNSHLGKPLNFDDVISKLQTYLPDVA